MSTSLLPMAGKTARNLHLHHRSDVWLGVWPGIVIKGREVMEAKNPDRRARCEKSLLGFLNEYLSHRFYDPSPDHLQLVQDLQDAILIRAMAPSMQAEADPRSFGKTTICEGATLWAVLYHHRRYIVFIGSKAPRGEERVESLKTEILNNARLCEDFPEIIEPVRAFGGDPRRAPPGYPWAGSEFRLMNGVYVEGRGIDSALRGLNKNGRPDLVFADDLETIDSVESETETKMIEKRLRQEVLGLHDINNPNTSYFIICTVIARGCIADRITNRELEPEFRGRRRKALKTPPERGDLWETFIDLCKGVSVDEKLIFSSIEETCAALGFESVAFGRLTESHQKALRFYAANKAEMDRGAVLLDQRRLPLHRIYYERATKGELYFLCELQNDPPAEQNQKSLQLELEVLLARRIGEKQGVVPAWADFVVASVDIGAYELHWEATAFGPGGSNCLIDQGVQQTGLNAGGQYRMTDEKELKMAMVEGAVREALGELRLRLSNGWARVNGEPMGAVLFGADCGGTAEAFAWYETVLRFCSNAPRWIPLKGAQWARSIADRAMGRNWIIEATNNPGRRHDCNVDEYKWRVARAFDLPVRDKDGNVCPGARVFHCETPTIYCRHQTAEKWIESVKDAPVGKDMRVGWHHDKTRPNHWWDTAWMCQALADIFGVIRGTPSLQAPAMRQPAMGVPQIPPEFQRERF